MHYSVKDKLKAKIRASKTDVFLRVDFASAGKYRQVSRALIDLEKELVLVRTGHGVYVRAGASVQIEQLATVVTSRLGKRVNRTITLGDTTVHLGRQVIATASDDHVLRRAKEHSQQQFAQAVAQGRMANTAGAFFTRDFFKGVLVDTARRVL